MTILGPDLASYQQGLDLSALTDASFFLIKATEGAGYVDPYYAGWLEQAKALGKEVVWYHFLTALDSPLAQAANVSAHVIDKSLPGMIDLEPEAGRCPTFAQLLAFLDAALLDGLTIRVVYLPAWVWSSVWGSPDLTPLLQRGILLIASNYPGASGTGPDQYAADGGDNGPGWAGYGGMEPTFWQFTDRASEDGQKIDYNAFRGTPQQLAALLGEPAPVIGPTTVSTTVVYPLLKEGSGGEGVFAVQALLTALGFDTQGIDGQFGHNTLAAVEHAQGAWGIGQDGEVGPQTRGAIGARLSALRYPGTLLVKGSSGRTVQLVQAMLWLRGYDPQGVDGVFGDRTLAAVAAFQSACGLARDGEVGPDTWGKLT